MRIAAFAIAHGPANLAAQTISASKAIAVRWTKQPRDKGHVKPDKVGGHKPHLLRNERDWLMQWLGREPNMALRQLLGELETRGVAVSYGTLWNSMHEQRLSS